MDTKFNHLVELLNDKYSTSQLDAMLKDPNYLSIASINLGIPTDTFQKIVERCLEKPVISEESKTFIWGPETSIDLKAYVSGQEKGYAQGNDAGFGKGATVATIGILGILAAFAISKNK
ncbi:hypothetical protein G3496_21200 [Shewanella baltica]|uniref:hypothetical protein n=1 Tax=Shewanella baltica TaxID=62322 RepID=UPI00217F0665|nr:hypothetical protein [Shewanella baltica]MCS6137419.1 hypothetical protein [Shewanella baltica]